MATNEALNRMLDRLSEKMETEIGHRGDMFVADYRPINKRAGVLLVGYSSGLPHVTTDDIKKYVITEFEGKLIPDLATAKLHKESAAVSLVVKQHQRTKKLEAKNDMVAVASTMFLDTEMNDTWEIKDKDGAKFLARLEKEDLDNIIQARRDRMQIKSSNICLASVSGGTPITLREGDVISYYRDDRKDEGVVLGVYANGIKVKTGGRVHAINIDEVLEVKEVSPSEKKKLDTNIREYFSTIYGDDYAKLLTPGA